MADEGDDWFGGGDDDAPPAVKPIGKKGEEAAEAAQEAAQEEEAAQEGEASTEAPLPEADEEYLDPDKLILFKHWVRPKFLPYKYLYMYRQNYYNDVMDYLDKRSRGIYREIPKAQTWAERMLRTFSDRMVQYRMYNKRIQSDLETVEKTRPKFLPYKCIYDYRRNYYDDVMEVLESRRRGVRRTIPAAQTWAERLCRQRSDPLWKLQRFDKFLDDVRLVTRTQISGDLYSYYAKDQFNKRYSKLLY